MIASFLTSLFFAISAVCGTRASQMLGGTSANFWRLLLATTLLAFWAHTWGLGIQGPAFTLFLISGFIGFGLGDLACFQAYPLLGSRLTALMVHSLTSPLAGLMEWLWMGTALSSQQILCSGIIIAGIILALAPDPKSVPHSGHLFRGIMFGIMAGTGQALGAVISRKAFSVADAAGMSMDGVTAAYQRILGGLVVAVIWYLLAQKKSSRESSPYPGKAWPWVTVNALAGPTIGVACFQIALKTTPAGIVLPIVATAPLLVIPFSRYVEGERPSPRSLLGCLIAVAGAISLVAFK